jgi:hypothetical protein
MYDVNNLMREHRNMLDDLAKGLKQNQRLRNKEEQRLNKAFEKARKAYAAPMVPQRPRKNAAVYKKVGFFLASLACAVIIFV